MGLSVHRPLAVAAADKDGPIGAREASIHRRYAPAAATSHSSSPDGAESGSSPASSWQPLPLSLPQRRRAGPSTSTDATTAPASRRTTARMTWPPERTPRRGLAGGSGGALSSPKPRGKTREEEYVGWLGSLRSGPQPRALAPLRDAGADASASAPPSPTASSAARVPPPRRSGGINASASTSTLVSAALPGTPQGRPQGSASDASLLGSTRRPLPALFNASHGARRQPPPPKHPTGTRAGRSLRPKTKPLAGTLALPAPETATPTPEASPPQTNPAPASSKKNPAPATPFLAAFGHRIIEVLFHLNFGHRCAPTPQLTKSTTRTRGDASLLQVNMAPLAPGALLPPHLAAFSHRIIEVLFNLNYGHLGYTGVVLLGVYAGLKDLLSGWNTILKIFYVLLLILGAFSLGTGLMAATSIAPTDYTQRVSSVCSRLCTCLATFVFIVALACHMGSYGYIAGILLGVVTVCYMLSVWIEGDPAASGAYTRVWTGTKNIWERFKWFGQRGPLLP